MVKLAYSMMRILKNTLKIILEKQQLACLFLLLAKLLLMQ